MTTDASGKYVFDTLALGENYTVAIEGEEAQTVEVSFVNDVVTVDFEVGEAEEIVVVDKAAL